MPLSVEYRLTATLDDSQASGHAARLEECYACTNGEDALMLYCMHRPDVVLMDIAMRGGDGIMATRRIKEVHPEARIVIVTNHDEPDLREAAPHAGASGYVLKTNLLELRTWLEHSA